LGMSRESDRINAQYTKPLGTPPTSIAVVKDTEEFAALEEEWEDLYRNSARVTPFQSWAWLYSWWEYYGEVRELRIVTVRDGDGLLVGLVPLMLERGQVFGRLLFLGSSITDHHDVLVREGWERQVAEAAVGALEQIGSWGVADLQELRPEAAAWGLFGNWSGPRASVWQSNCPVVDVKPWEELLGSLSKNLRSTFRRTLRRAEGDGLRCEQAGIEEAERAGRTLVALHRQAWQRKEIGPEHLTRRFEAHLEASARRMIARGLGAVSEFWRDGEVIISQFLVFGHGYIGNYMIGASQEALERYQFSSLYIWDAMNVALSGNSRHLDLGRGEEPYKLRWSSRVVPNHRVILGRNPLFWAPYAGYHALRSKAKRSADSEEASRWIKDVRDKYRTLRRAATRFTGKDKRS
jgi:CelD/BcsL family acetyltransferase involved in cellulose biosynthesis